MCGIAANEPVVFLGHISLPISLAVPDTVPDAIDTAINKVSVLKVQKVGE